MKTYISHVSFLFVFSMSVLNSYTDGWRLSQGQSRILLSNIFKTTTCAAYASMILVLPNPSIAENTVHSAPVAEKRRASNEKVTAKVGMEIAIGANKRDTSKLQIGLFGEDAPTASKFFLNMCQGDLGKGLSYNGAQVSKVVKDYQIEVNKFSSGSDKKLERVTSTTGVTRTKAVEQTDLVRFDDNNDLQHDVPGIVSMKRGGGSFGFTIAPGPNEDLDEGNVVVGKVMNQEGLDLIDRINQVPTSKEDFLGMKQGFSAAGKGFDPRARIASVNRPLQKIRINQCNVESANMAQLMKF